MLLLVLSCSKNVFTKVQEKQANEASAAFKACWPCVFWLTSSSPSCSPYSEQLAHTGSLSRTCLGFQSSVSILSAPNRFMGYHRSRPCVIRGLMCLVLVWMYGFLGLSVVGVLICDGKWKNSAKSCLVVLKEWLEVVCWPKAGGVGGKDFPLREVLG